MWSGRRPRSPPASPPPCRRAARSDRASGRPRSTRRRSPTRRTRRSRRGSRSPDGSRRSRCRARPAAPCHRAGTTRPGSTHRGRRRGRPSRHAARHDPAPSRYRRCRCRAARGAGDPDRDLAAVGDQQAADHQCRQIPYSRVPSTTLLCAAEIANASTVRVSRGWMIPSSHTRPVA